MDRLNIAIKAAVSGGNLLKENYGKVAKEKQKESFRDVVTEIDELSESTILQIIEEHYPDDSLLTEESGFHDKNSEGMWIIDALDGTVNYIHGIPLFCVSIAYWKNMHPELGVIYNPLSGDLYYAQRGTGSFLNQDKLNTMLSTIEKNICLMAFSGKAHDPQNRLQEFKLFGELNDFSQGCLRTGSAAVNLGYLAEGKCGFASGKANKLWDIAAGIIIAQEAGMEVNFNIINQEKYLVDYIAGSPPILSQIKNNIDITYLDTEA